MVTRKMARAFRLSFMANGGLLIGIPSAPSVQTIDECRQMNKKLAEGSNLDIRQKRTKGPLRKRPLVLVVQSPQTRWHSKGPLQQVSSRWHALRAGHVDWLLRRCGWCSPRPG